MGVQEFASTVLANKDRYSPAMVRKANFAHNAAGWKHAFGGEINNDTEPKTTIAVSDKYEEDRDSLALAKSARRFAEILGSGKPLMDIVNDIPPYYRYGNGRTLFDEAYQSKLGAPSSWYRENENRVRAKLINQADRIERNQKQLAFGGPMGNMYPDGSQLRTFRAPKVTLNLKDTFKLPEEKETDITSSTNEMFDNQNRWLDDFGNYYWGKHNIDESDKRHNRLLGEAADYANGYMGYGWFNGNSLAQTLRAVPVIGSAINAIGDAVGWRNKEDYTWSDRIGDAARTIRNVKSTPIGGYMSYNPYDVDYEMNRLQNVGLGTQRALLDTTGGNSLAARNAMLALNNNITSQMGEARRGAAAANEERRKGVQQFNTGIDQFNAGQSLNSQIYNQRADEERVNDIIRQAMLADSIQSATSQARSTEETAALNNAGQWGNDMMYNDMARYYLEHIAPNNDATRDASWILGRRYGANGGKIKKSNIKEFKKK